MSSKTYISSKFIGSFRPRCNFGFEQIPTGLYCFMFRRPPARRLYDIESPSELCTQSAEMRLAVSGAKPLFTLGLLMFALSLVDFLSLLLSPSTDIKIFSSI